MDDATSQGRHDLFRRDERGAVALMSLASILILVLMGMILFDLAEMGVDKTHLQTATDTSAFSQATVEAQSMNMMAFGNAGKRMTVGMLTTYISLYQWISNIEHLIHHSDPENPFMAASTGFCDQPDLEIDQFDMEGICEVVREILDIFVPDPTGTPSMEYAASPVYHDVRGREGLNTDDRIGAGMGTHHHTRSYIEPGTLPEPDEDRPRAAIFTKGERKEMAGTNTYFPVQEWAAYIASVQAYTDRVSGVSDAFYSTPPTCDGGTTQIDCVGPDGSIRDGEWTPGKLIGQFYGRDLIAYDNYQKYLKRMSPYWAFTEGVMRGIVNLAPVTVGYPMPDFEVDLGSQSRQAALPVTRASLSDICLRVGRMNRGVDTLLGVDLARQAAVDDIISDDPWSFGPGGSVNHLAKALAIYALLELNELDDGDNRTHQILARDWESHCDSGIDSTIQLLDAASGGGAIGDPNTDLIEGFREFGEPYLINTYEPEDQALWLLDSSRLMVGFRPNISRFKDDRDKFFLPAEPLYEHAGAEAGGTWAMARSEIAYQGSDTPHLWAPRWSARLRPVALPQEWSDLHLDEWEDPAESLPNFHLERIILEMEETLEAVTKRAGVLDEMPGNHLMTYNFGAGAEAENYLTEEFNSIGAAARALRASPMTSESRMEGLSK